ncbi:MAG TPA: hypothetical protein VH816_17955 [Gaiellaceae bacterium]
MKVAAIARAGRRCMTAAIVGLGAHAALYRSLWPNDSVHGYLGWYTLVVAVLSLATIAGLAIALVLALRARRLGRPLPVLGAGAPERSYGSYVADLAVSGLVWVYLQETLEHSIPNREFVFVAFGPGQVLGLLLCLAGGALVLGLLLRAGARVVRAVLRGGDPLVGEPTSLWTPHPAERHARRPLAARFALRAPPLLSTA